MSADALLAGWLRTARRRALGNVALLWMPAALVASAAAWRWLGWPAAIAVGLLSAGGIAFVAAHFARTFDLRWLVRRLDTQRADMEDSASLLLDDPADLGTLGRLQRVRLEQRIAAAEPIELAPPWRSRPIVLAWVAAVLVVALLIALPREREQMPPLAPVTDDTPAQPGIPRLVAQRLRIVPPSYTGLPAHYAATLDTRAPQGSRLEWTLRFVPDPPATELSFHDGRRIPLASAGDVWTGAITLDRSALYRIVPRAPIALQPRLHRLDAIPDAVPQVRLIAPDRTLVLATPGQRRWQVVFEAIDDYGIAIAADLRLTLAQGEGENIRFTERTMPLSGTGDPRRRRFTASLDLAGLGFSAGNDLVAQITVRDMHAPGPHVVRGPSVILRWPPDLGRESSGLEGAVKKAMPAYFRSQRQIIIDAEALLKERPRLSDERFLSKSDAIGVDQRILRLRYGQFLGEEAEDGASPLPTNDATTLPTADAPATAPATEAHDDHEPPTPTAPGFGSAGNVLSEFGHTHDEAEAATLLDPETRAILRQALDQMWQSELNLRQGKPRDALPHAYKALGFIKQVQQATRIFLSRVGPELPPIEESRRLTGKREGIASRPLPAPTPGDMPEAPVATAWRALGKSGSPPDLAALERWIGTNQARIPDPLALVAALDGVRREPGCARCRAALRGQLWSVLDRPAPNVARRDGGDAADRRYLDAIDAR